MAWRESVSLLTYIVRYKTESGDIQCTTNTNTMYILNVVVYRRIRDVMNDSVTV